MGHALNFKNRVSKIWLSNCPIQVGNGATLYYTSSAIPFRPLHAQNSGMKQKGKPRQKGKTASYYQKKSVIVLYR
jgi:hypothetical protein